MGTMSGQLDGALASCTTAARSPAAGRTPATPPTRRESVDPLAAGRRAGGAERRLRHRSG